MADTPKGKLSEQLVEQKLTYKKTIDAGDTDVVSLDIPTGRTVYLKGYGYTWYASNVFQLANGNALFPARTDQEGSPAIPVIYGSPFLCRSGGKLTLTITNGDSVSHDYNVVFYLLTNEFFQITSEGDALTLSVGSSSGTSSTVVISNAGLTATANVTAKGLATDPQSPATLLCSYKTTTGASAEALAASTACRKVTLQADINNSEPMLVGNATAQTISLDGGQSVTIEIDNLSKVYIKRSGSANVTANYIGS